MFSTHYYNKVNFRIVDYYAIILGTIDFREFTIALSKLSQGTIRQKLSLAFYLYDENCDGVLTFDEVLGIVEVSALLQFKSNSLLN